MRNFYRTCKFSTLTINFSEVWPRQILDLVKQFNLMIRLENVLKISLQDLLKMSWRRVCKTSWRRFENFLKTYGQDEYIRLDQDVLKTEDIWVRRLYSPWSRRLEDVFWRRRRKISSGSLQNVFIKTNVCWVYLNFFCAKFASN